MAGRAIATGDLTRGGPGFDPDAAAVARPASLHGICRTAGHLLRWTGDGDADGVIKSDPAIHRRLISVPGARDAVLSVFDLTDFDVRSGRLPHRTGKFQSRPGRVFDRLIGTLR